MVWRNLVACVLVFAITLPRGQAATDFTLPTAVACVLTGVLGPYLHGLFFLQALQFISASRASLMGRIQPVIVFAVSFVVLQRSPSAPELWSAAILTAGTFWLIRVRPRRGA
jgi:drug/metabolite transporter (DMT)-like permease